MQNEKEMPVMTVMALYYELPVFKDVYKMTLRIFELTANFSREYKFTLGQDLKRDCILLVRSIYRANKHNNNRVCCLAGFYTRLKAALQIKNRLT